MALASAAHCLSPEECGPDALIIRFEPRAVSFPVEFDYGHDDFLLGIEDAAFTDSELQAGLQQLGAATFETVAPGWRHLTEKDLYDRHGDRVAELVFTPPPDDPLYPDQWNLENTGQTGPDPDCIPDIDIDAPEAWSLWDRAGTKMGISDCGIFSDHEDLAGLIDPDLSKSFVRNVAWDDVGIGLGLDGDGTRVAGVAGAGADNGVGLAGVANLVPNHADPVLVALRVFDLSCGQQGNSLAQVAARG